MISKFELPNSFAHYQRGGLGDVKVKRFLNAIMQETLEPIRNRRKELKHTWVSFDKISPSLPMAVIASEDNRFAEHTVYSVL